jgi:hypothetical protein
VAGGLPRWPSSLRQAANATASAIEVIVPLYRIAGREPHFRFRYVADGKQVSEETARALWTFANQTKSGAQLPKRRRSPWRDGKQTVSNVMRFMRLRSHDAAAMTGAPTKESPADGGGSGVRPADPTARTCDHATARADKESPAAGELAGRGL